MYHYNIVYPTNVKNYFISRSLNVLSGRVLLYNSMLILVLVLRYTITVMRELGIGAVLPLDNNIYLHKVVGYLIFVQATVHTVMHLCNFGEERFFWCFFFKSNTRRNQRRFRFSAVCAISIKILKYFF